jgi:hypothetical protein
VEPVDGVLEVRVDVTNRGAAAATTLDIRAELGERTEVKTIAAGVPPGGTRSAVFPFPPPARAGVHVLGLRLDYVEKGGPEGGTSQRAFLLLGIGANPPPTVKVSAGETAFGLTGTVPVRVESADGQPHRARVRVLTPRNLNANEPVEVDVPARGAVAAEVAVLRGSVPRPSRHGVLAVAETLDGEFAHAAVAATIVHVSADPALMPRLRPWLAGLAIVLLAAAGYFEWRRRRDEVRAASRESPDGHVDVDVDGNGGATE